MRTSGAAVVFSGLTVMVSLAGLFLLDSTVMRSMAIGAIVVVVDRDPRRRHAAAGAHRAAREAGRRARPRRERHRRARAQGDAPQDSGRARRAAGRVLARWSERVMRGPRSRRSSSAGFLLVLAIPALSLSFGNGALRAVPQGLRDARRGFELASQKVPPGASAPTIVVADFGKGAAADPANRRRSLATPRA